MSHIRHKLLSLALLCCLPFTLNAQTSSTYQAPVLTPQAPEVAAKNYIIMDASNGKVLAEHNSNERSEPASLTKMMTAYVIFGALKNEQISLNETVDVSDKAWKMSGSRMFIEPRLKPTVEQLIRGIAVTSGNDASVAMAEHIAGSEAVFAELMNQMAAQLGMHGSHFTDSTGLPDPDHYSTPHDMAILARALRTEFPEYYHYFKEKSFTYNDITQTNRNQLLWRDDHIDGLKTGHTNAAGYCLASSASYDHINLVTVVMGSNNTQQRNAATQSLLTWGSRFFETLPLYKPNQAATTVRVWKGKNKTISLGVTTPKYVTIPKGAAKRVKVLIKHKEKDLFAPIQRNQVYAQATVTINQQAIATVPLVALEDTQKGGLWIRSKDAIRYKIHQWLS